MSVQLGEIAERMISAPSSNSRPRRSHTPKRTQISLRVPRTKLPENMRQSIVSSASPAPSTISKTAPASTPRATSPANDLKSSSIAWARLRFGLSVEHGNRNPDRYGEPDDHDGGERRCLHGLRANVFSGSHRSHGAFAGLLNDLRRC